MAQLKIRTWFYCMSHFSWKALGYLFVDGDLRLGKAQMCCFRRQ